MNVVRLSESDVRSIIAEQAGVVPECAPGQHRIINGVCEICSATVTAGPASLALSSDEGCDVCGGEGCPECVQDCPSCGSSNTSVSGGTVEKCLDCGYEGCDVCGGDGCPHCMGDGSGRLPEVKLTEIDMASDTDGTDVGDPLGDLIKALEQAGDILLGAQGMTEESPELAEYRDKVSAAENAVTEALRQAKSDRDGTW